MNKQLYKRIISVQTALLLVCSSLAGNGIPAAAALQDEAPSAEIVTEAAESCAPVNVIVTLDADALLPGLTAEQLVTPEAAAESAVIAAEQDAVIAQLTEWYPELEVGYRYNVLTNAFSCKLPENLLDDAEALPAVRSVARSYKVHAVPEAASEEDISNAMQFQSQTGCLGDGQVIAIIDSELDLEHPMFAPLADDVQTKLTQEQVEAISDNIGFNVQIGTEYVWHSSKIPFAADYEDQIPMNVRDARESAYHGTHVAGIAAGNVYEDAEGRTLSGIAPNAQIVFMAMQYISDVTEFIGALEDAVKLQADAVNLSMGYCGETPGKEDPFRDAVNTAEAAGVTVCISAGNCADGTLVSPRQTADNPDVSTMNVLVQEGTRALAVASADNPSEFEQHAMLLGEQKIGYSSYVMSISTADTPKLLSDTLKEASYEYEYCGLGDLSDFEGKDLTGKLALVDRGILSFTEKALHAQKVGAVGVIVIQNRPDEYFTPVSNADIPIGIVSVDNGELLKNAEDKKISFTDELVTVSLPADVSFYTSYGVHNSLDLRPDIMGVGGFVESAAYHNSTSVQSGTSMASPYIAGCAMLLNEYLQKHGCTLTGSEKEQYIRNLLMTGAYPYSERGLFVSPRRQGAGMVSMERTLGTKVLLTGSDGESKLSLRDKLGDNFTFPVTLRNISDEDVTFKNARLVLTTDDTFYNRETDKYEIDHQQALKCTADLSGLTAIAAGEARTENVTVQLDASQTAALRKIFTNGFFVEGYLLLEGAENSSDISIPLLGYSDDFEAIPIVGEHSGAFVTLTSSNAVTATTSFSDLLFSDAGFLYEIENARGTIESLQESGDADLWEDNPDPSVQNYLRLLDEYENKAMNTWGFPERVYISPNHDYLADKPGIRINAQRDCIIQAGALYDAKGNLLTEPYTYNECSERTLQSEWQSEYIKQFQNVYMPLEDLSDLPEGDYTYRISAAISKEALEKNPQVLEIPVTIDKTAPKLESSVTEKNGRKILKLTATDPMLDSISFFCIGDGKLVSPSGADAPKKIDAKFMPIAGGLYSDCAWYNLHLDDLSKEMEKSDYNRSKLLPAAGFLNEESWDPQTWFDQFDYSEFMQTKPDADGKYTLEYDITDLKGYHIAVMDRAYNMSYIDVAPADARPMSVAPGLYQGAYGLYEFGEGTVRYIPFVYLDKTLDCHYEIESDWVTSYLHAEADTWKPGKYEGIGGPLTGNPETGYVIDNSNVIGHVGFYQGQGIPELDKDVLKPTGLKTADGYLAINSYEAENSCVKPLMAELTGCYRIINMTYDVQPDAVVTFTGECCSKDLKQRETVSITLDYKTGIATLPDGSKRDFSNTEKLVHGDTDLSGQLDVADAVLLARYLVEDREAVVQSKGLNAADCNHNGTPDNGDLSLILMAIAKKVEL